MRNVLVVMLAGLVSLIYLTSCATTAPTPAKTQLQMRQFSLSVGIGCTELRPK